MYWNAVRFAHRPRSPHFQAWLIYRVALLLNLISLVLSSAVWVGYQLFEPPEPRRRYSKMHVDLYFEGVTFNQIGVSKATRATARLFVVGLHFLTSA